jgi:hypothetical protein
VRSSRCQPDDPYHFNLAVIDKRLFKNHLIRTWLDSIRGKCKILFFSGVFEPEEAICLFFTGSGIGLRITKGSGREGELQASGERDSFELQASGKGEGYEEQETGGKKQRPRCKK